MLIRAIMLTLGLCFGQVANDPAQPPTTPEVPTQEERDYAITMQAGNRCGFNLRCQLRQGRLIDKLRSRPLFQRLRERRAAKGC